MNPIKASSAVSKHICQADTLPQIAFPLQVDFLSTLRILAPAIGSASSASSPGNFLTTGIVPEIGRIVLTLAELCSYVDVHRPLQLARIVSTACYAEDAGSVIHRFLVIELHMPGRKTIWLRLDRRMANNVSFWDFLKASGETAANDAVCAHQIL